MEHVELWETACLKAQDSYTLTGSRRFSVYIDQNFP
jgi:hypothetical protein